MGAVRGWRRGLSGGVAFLAVGVFLAGGALAAYGQGPSSASEASTPIPAASEISEKSGELQVVATSHLDTQWRWTVQETIDEYIAATWRDNLDLIDRYPGYTFSFEGAFRYQLAKEYYPEAYERMRRAIAGGRWRVAGSWVDAVDTNMPSPESLIRHVLYGNGYFRREFGQTSRDVFLPDCFGFGYALPSIAAHCGLIGFSTQKLTWGSAVGVPFDLGRWQGVDGSSLIAALNPGAYVGRVRHDLSSDSAAIATIRRQGEQSGLYTAFRYFGTGDTGGAPDEESVAWVEKSQAGTGPVRVRCAASDDLMRQIASRGPEVVAALPAYEGELLMTDHGVGCYTSQSEMKRWNRRNEQAADAAERAACLAAWLGGSTYPRELLREAWIRFLWHQFHDDLTGTSIPEAYTFSWNDEAIAHNQFTQVLDDAAGAVIRALDTRVKGTPIVVYNPVAIEREDVVEAVIEVADAAGIDTTDAAEIAAGESGRYGWGRRIPARPEPPSSARAIRVRDADGREVPAQVIRRDGGRWTIAFLARVPSVGFAVFEARVSDDPCRIPTGLSVTPSSLGSRRYQVTVNDQGDVASIYDFVLQRELLSAPLRLEMLADRPWDWAAWEIDHDDIMAPPAALVGRPARVRILEHGPARVALEISREARGSTITQTIRLCAGEAAAADRISFDTEIDWNTPGMLLKAAFPIASGAEQAVYDLGLGTIARGVNRPELYEVPAQQWADLPAEGGEFGVAVMNDCRHGWDRPDRRTLRLTLVRTPEVNERWRWIEDQASQDLGVHHLSYALSGHAGDWRTGGVPRQAECFNQPLRAWTAPKSKGALGRRVSFASVSTPSVAVKAIKLAEESDELIVRLHELHGAPQSGVALRFARPITSFRELNGAEETLESMEWIGSGVGFSPGEPAVLEAGTLRIDFRSYQPRTFALRLSDPPARIEAPRSEPVELPYNLVGMTACRHGIEDGARAAERREAERAERARGHFATETPAGADGATPPAGAGFDSAGRTFPAGLLPAQLERDGIEYRFGPREEQRANVLACRGQELALPQGEYNRLYLLATAVGGDRPATFFVDGESYPFVVRDWSEPVAQWYDRVAGAAPTSTRERIVPAYLKTDPVAWVGTHRHTAYGGREAYAFAQLFRYRIDLPPGARTLRLPDDPAVRIFAASVAWNPNDAVRPATDPFEAPRRTGVRLEASREEFLDSTLVRMSSPHFGSVVRYTLDGSEPTGRSTRYEGPLTLTGEAQVRARAFDPAMDEGEVAALTVRRMAWREGVPLAMAEGSAAGGARTREAPRLGLRPGLQCRLHEGRWSRLPDFGSLKPGRREVVPAVGLPASAPLEHFGLQMQGYLRIPADGLYTLHLWSDDGSALWLDDEKVIDNDGLHGNGEVARDLALRAGYHPIRVEFFQGQGGRALDLTIEGPGLGLLSVPAAMLFH